MGECQEAKFVEGVVYSYTVVHFKCYGCGKAGEVSFSGNEKVGWCPCCGKQLRKPEKLDRTDGNT